MNSARGEALVNIVRVASVKGLKFMARIFRHHVSPIKLTLAVTDVVLITGCAFFAEWLRLSALDLDYVQSSASLVAKLAIPLFAFPLLLGFGAYQSDAMGDMKVFFPRMIVALITGLLLTAAFAYLLPTLPLWRSILLLSFGLSVVAILVSHAAFILFAKDSFLGRRIVILGAGSQAVALKSEADNSPEAGLKIIAVVALPGDPIAYDEAIKLDDPRGLPELIDKLNCELIVIGDRLDNQSLPIEALIACKLAGVQIMDRLAFFEEVRGYVDIDSTKADWIIFAEGFKGGSILERGAKRAMDIVISVVFLLLAFPVTVISALLIKLTSKGPVFYRQERVGLNGKHFDVLKLRSMTVDAEQSGVPEFAKEKDPRVTAVGGFLRRTRIDEIPQTLNVLMGDMSFVGPRPERPYFVDQLKEKVPFYAERHCLKPGITGWAQIRYPYGASFEDSRRKLEYDLYYIKNYSLFLDLLIILQTLRVVLFPHGVR